MDLLDLSVRITADDQASGQIQSLGAGVIAQGTAIGSMVSQGITAAAGAIVDFGKETINTGMSFDTAMSQVAATMGTTTDQIGGLRDMAKDMGSSTKFSATEAAEAMNYMALAGYDAETTMEMLPTVLDLAAAGGMDLASASDMVTDSQTALGLSLDETTVLVDQMAATASNSNTSVSQLGDAILTVGGTAQNLSGGITEMNTVLGVMADNGIKGSEAGTHLRNIILSLSAPTDTAAAALSQLGVSATDMEGNLRPIPDIMQDLNMAMDGLSQEEKTQALSKIFNKTDLASVNALLYTTVDNVEEVGQALLDTGVSFQYFDDASLSSQEQAAGMAAYISNALGVMQGDIDATAQKIAGEFNLSFEDAKTLVQATADTMGESTGRFDELRAAIEGSDGAASQMAATMQDNLEGSLTSMNSAIEGIQIGLSEMMTPALREMVDTATTGFQQMAQQLSAGDLLGAFTTLGETVAQLAAQFLECLPAMLDAGLQMITGLVQGIANGAPQLTVAAAQAVVGLVQAVIQNLPMMVEAALSLVNGLAQGILQALPVLIAAIPPLIQGAITALTALIPIIAEAGVTLFSALIQNAPAIIAAIAGALPALIQGIITGITTLVPMMVQAGITLFMGLVQNIPGIISAIVGALPAIVGGIVDGFMGLLNPFSGVGQGMATETVTGLSTLPDQTGTVFTSAYDSATGAWSGAGGYFTGVAGEVNSGVTGEIDSMSNNVVDSITFMSDSGVASINDFSAEGTSEFQSFMDSLSDGSAEVSDTVTDNFSGMADAGISEMQTLESESVSSAEQTSSGVNDALSNMSTDSIDAFNDLVDAAEENFNHLNSTVVDAMGNLDSCVETGMSEMLSYAEEGFDGMNQAASSAMEEINSITESSMTEMSSIVVNETSKAQTAMQECCDAMMAAWNGMTFSTPHIPMPTFSASGTFNPTANPPTVPSFSVSWHKDGGILTGATIFGAMGNKLLGGGEAGKEAVLPIDKLKGYVEDGVISALGDKGYGDIERNFTFNVTINATSDLQNEGRKIAEKLYTEIARHESDWIR